MKKLASVGVGLALLGAALLWLNPISPELAFTLISVGGLMTIWFKLGSLETDMKRVTSDLANLADKVEKHGAKLNDFRVAFEAQCMRVERLEEMTKKLVEGARKKRKTT